MNFYLICSVRVVIGQAWYYKWTIGDLYLRNEATICFVAASEENLSEHIMSKSEPQVLLQELQRLEGLRNPQSAQHLRKYERHIVRIDAELLHMDRSSIDQAPVAVLVRDLGRAGVGFVSPVELEVESTWHLAFLRNGYVIGRQGVVIRHCRRIGDNAYLVGGQFCIESGLMTLLGIDPGQIHDGAAPSAGVESDEYSDQYLSPDDLAKG